MKQKKHWSWSVGERGRSRVRAFREKRSGKLYLEYYEHGVRMAELLVGVTSTEEAKSRARLLSRKFDAMANVALPREPIALDRLVGLYLEEVTPKKGSDSKRAHDRRAARVFATYFNALDVQARQMTRLSSTLDRVDWDGFISARRAGSIPGWRATRDRQVQYDLIWMIGVLNWATGTMVDGVPHLDRNPWGRDIRKAQKWVMPRERSSRRVPMTDDLRELLAASAPCAFSDALILERETRRRNNSIRQLMWSDIDLVGETAQWRSELDKSNRWAITPLTPAALQVLKRMPRGIGDTPLFPHADDPSKPATRHTFQRWLKRAKAKVLRAIEDPERREHMKRRLRGVGFHSEKRTGVRDPEFRKLPPSIQEALAGTDYDTLRKIYDDPSVEDMRNAINGTSAAESRVESRVGG